MRWRDACDERERADDAVCSHAIAATTQTKRTAGLAPTRRHCCGTKSSFQECNGKSPLVQMANKNEMVVSTIEDTAWKRRVRFCFNHPLLTRDHIKHGIFIDSSGLLRFMELTLPKPLIILAAFPLPDDESRGPVPHSHSETMGTKEKNFLVTPRHCRDRGFMELQ
jgi:hypothetical protein